MAYKAPKSIINHPGVQECNCGDAEGSDYKHDVWLHEGWVWSSGRNVGKRGLFVNSVAEFKEAAPVKVRA